MKERVLSVLLVSVIVSLFCMTLPFHVAASEPKYGGTLKIGMRVPQYKWIDARYPTTPTLCPIPAIIYETLYDWGEDGSKSLVPQLATKIETTDNMVFTVHLRKGVKFHNGREMTAEDIKANFDWRINPPKGWKPPRYHESLKYLKAAEVVDKYTVKIILDKPYAQFLRVYTRFLSCIAPPEEVEKWGDNFNLHPCGTGPFKVVEVVPNEKVVLERFEDYWGPRPYLDRVEYLYYRSNDSRMLALEKGEINMAQLFDEHRPLLEKDPNLTFQPVTTPHILWTVYFNMRRWPMNDVRFRKAVRMGVDWKTIVPNVFPFKSGTYVKTFLDLTKFYHPEVEELVPAFNQDEAKELIQAVEKDAGKKIPPIYWLDSNWAPGQVLSQAAKAQLTQVGIPLDIHSLDHGIYFNKVKSDPKLEWDLCVYGIGYNFCPTFGFQMFETNARITPDGKSLGGYSNPEFDRLLYVIESSTDETETDKAYQDIEKILLTDMPGIPLFPHRMLYGYNKNVKGVVFNDMGIPYITRTWCNFWIDE